MANKPEIDHEAALHHPCAGVDGKDDPDTQYDRYRSELEDEMEHQVEEGLKREYGR